MSASRARVSPPVDLTPAGSPWTAHGYVSRPNRDTSLGESKYVRSVAVSDDATTGPTAGSWDSVTVALDQKEPQSSDRLGVQMRTEDLYPSPSRDSLVGSALRLLGQAIEALDVLANVEDDRPFDVEYQISSVRALLPDLFCCRKLSDGFGQVVVAIWCALSSHGGEPLDRARVNALRKAFVMLKAKPALTAESATDAVMGLEAAGLETEPPELSSLLELLAEESLR